MCFPLIYTMCKCGHALPVVNIEPDGDYSATELQNHISNQLCGGVLA